MLNNVLKHIVPNTKLLFKRICWSIGLDVRLNRLSVRDDLRLVHFLTSYNIDLVLDIGANRGQFAQALFKDGYRGRIVSFEALPNAHQDLIKNSKQFCARWGVAPAMALSDREGWVTFHLNAADTTSSMLNASQTSLMCIPEVRPKQDVNVRTSRLDIAIEELGLDVTQSFLKIDVQGAEALVLAGAIKTLEKASGLIVELSLVRLYDGQPLAMEVLPDLMAMGFEIHDIWQGYRNRNTHQLYQVDVIMFHSDRISHVMAE